jgi:GNAT superfamily N-acetyltransferase
MRAFAIGNAHMGNVWALFVPPQDQGRGFGTRLHAAMLAWLSSRPVCRLWLTTGATTRARAFCVHLGWSCAGSSGAAELRYERDNAA